MNLNITGLKVDSKGEGSRGGHVIGHTSSGKPIYMNHSKHVGLENEKNRLNPEEHFQAGKLHKEKGEFYNSQLKNVEPGPGAQHAYKALGDLAKHHFIQSEKHNITGRQLKESVMHLGRK